MRAKSTAIVTMIVLLGAYSVSTAATYYVATNGSDSNPGTESQPWRTVTYAAQQVGAGDTVYIRQGTYNERLVVQSSGAVGNWSIFASYTGETATLDGTGISLADWEGVIDLSGHSYVRIEGLTVTNSQGSGIYADQSAHLVIQGCTTNDTASSGIGIWSSRR